MEPRRFARLSDCQGGEKAAGEVSAYDRRYAVDNASEVYAGEPDRRKQRESVFAVERKRNEHCDRRNGNEHERDYARQPRVIEEPTRVIDQAERENNERCRGEAEFVAVDIHDEHRRSHRQKAQYQRGNAKRSDCFGGAQNIVRSGNETPYKTGKQHRERKEKPAEFESESVIFNI